MGDCGHLVEFPRTPKAGVYAVRQGPVLAQNILEHRRAHGPFSRAEDLLNVSGIGPSTLEAIRDLVVIP